MKKIRKGLISAVTKLFKNTFLAAAIGVVVGVIIFLLNGWNLLEPVIGIVTLTIALSASLKVTQSLQFQGEQFRTLADMDRKDFEVTFGLRKGYQADGGEFSLESATGFIQEWMQGRVNKHLAILTGKVNSINLVYPVRNTEDGSRVTIEPSVSYSGILSPHYDKNRQEEEIIQTLNSLAEFIGKKLEQKRIYLSFKNKSWIIETKM
ncbi:MAG: hypothetical protein WC249_02970 [Patescibacteria group bacterium]|jgi:hypothetical protein